MALEHPELTIEGIVNFAVNIEEESADFYDKAYNRFSKSDSIAKEVLTLLAFLQEEEVRHKRVIKQRFEKMSDPGVKLPYDNLHNAVGNIVGTPDIPEDASSKEVLETALKREENTAALYRVLYSISELAHMAPIFEDLVHQEEGHANRIKSALKGIFHKTN
jgi:rubrerythrin